ncbi:MAG: Spo0E family sporulation regulatory protein-aspartic acid phosphatase [Hungatella sp.]|nr:Spo0E family sporulation regulatory protein-aspartic acid phosphatase [Hungatella sp.]
MENSKEELIRKIESARLILNKSIDEKRNYEEIYQNSIALDALIEEYIIAGY